MGMRLTHRRPVGDGRDVLLHMAAWLPIGHVDGERLETLVPRAGAESARRAARAARRRGARAGMARCTCIDTIVASQ